MEVHYSPVEELANALTHGIGAILAIAASAVLITLAAVWGDGWRLASAIIFGSSLFLLYASSTLYHALPNPKAKRVFKVLDHCAIFLLIAGTYTPFTLIGLRGQGADWLLPSVWAVALAGILFKLFFTGRFKLASTLMYLAMGWMAIPAADAMMASLPTHTLAFLLAGGIAYSLGAVFYLNKRLRFGHAVWHLFVLAGSTLHFVAVTQQVISPV